MVRVGGPPADLQNHPYQYLTAQNTSPCIFTVMPLHFWSDPHASRY